jgi:hypothetical protein
MSRATHPTCPRGARASDHNSGWARSPSRNARLFSFCSAPSVAARGAWVMAALLVLAGIACDSEQTCPLVGPPARNNPPAIHAERDTSIVLGDTLRLQATATDPDGDALKYYLTVILRDVSESDYVADAHLDSINGEFWFAPGVRDMPERSIMITVTDEDGVSSSTLFTVKTSYYKDQANDSYSTPLFQNVRYCGPMGQEFVPIYGALDIVELQLMVGGTSEFQVRIREETITGPTVGASRAFKVPGSFVGTAIFEFERIQLVPHETYVIEIIASVGSGMVGSPGIGKSTYPYGRQIIEGEPKEINDLWFREGVKFPLPGGGG